MRGVLILSPDRVFGEGIVDLRESLTRIFQPGQKNDWMRFASVLQV